MLQSSPSEVVLFKGDELHVIPEIGEDVNIGEWDIDYMRTVINKSKSRDFVKVKVSATVTATASATATATTAVTR